MGDSGQFGELSQAVIGAAIEVHKHLGPGLLESIYESCLCRELETNSICFQRQVSLPVHYKGESLGCEYRFDLVVEKSLIVEIKSVEKFIPVHTAQMLTYLKISGKKTGLVINFNTAVLKDGLRRFVL
jgi:GxxExxY protein